MFHHKGSRIYHIYKPTLLDNPNPLYILVDNLVVVRYNSANTSKRPDNYEVYILNLDHMDFHRMGLMVYQELKIRKIILIP